MSWWHWALIGAGGFVVGRELQKRAFVIRTDEDAPSDGAVAPASGFATLQAADDALFFGLGGAIVDEFDRFFVDGDDPAEDAAGECACG